MSRTKTMAAVATLTALTAITLVAGPASAGKPPAIASSSASANADCSVDVEITLNSRGRLPALVQVHYWQQSTHNGDSYWYVAPTRGETRKGNLPFAAADPAFGTTYEVGYTAFARNGSILSTGVIGTVDTDACF